MNDAFLLRSGWTGAFHGALAGLSFAGLEGGYVLGTGEGVPWTLPAVCAAIYTAVGALLGLASAALFARVGPERADASLLAASVGSGAVAVLLGGAERSGSLAAAIVVAAIGMPLSYGAGLILFRSPLLANRSPAIRAAIVPPVALFALVLIADLDRRIVEPASLLLRSAGVLIVAAACAVAVLAIDRLTARFHGGTRAALLVVACLATLAPGLGVALDTSRRGPESALPPGQHAAGTRPHVILVVLDTARADHMSAYGYSRDTTPRLSELARTSIVFDSAQSFDSWTQPSHEALFTGRYPEVYHPVLPPDSLTLAEILAGEGYRTAALVANSGVLHPSFGFDQGFEIYDARARCRVRYRPLCYGMLSRLSPLAFHRSLRWYRGASSILEQGLGLLRSAASRDEPLFLFVNLMEPHWPYVPEAPYHDSFAGYRHGEARLYEAAPWGVWEDLGFSERERELLVALYDGEIASADAALGRFLDELERDGLLDEALIVITSDHGELLGEHDFVGHDHGLYQETQHVPLIVRYPGGSPTGRRKETVSLADVFSIVLSETGAPAEVWNGSTVARVGEDRASFERFQPVLALHRPSEREEARYGNRFLFKTWCAYSDGPRLKYCETSRNASWLAHLDPDASERTDSLADPVDLPARSAHLEAALAEFRGRTAAADRRAADAPEIDPEALEGLRALGYVD